MEEESTPVASSQTTIPSIINEKIPLVDLQANLETIRPEIDEAITQLIDTCYFVGSPKVSNLKKSSRILLVQNIA